MIRKLLLGVLTALWTAGAQAQTVQQTGVVTPGHAAVWGANGVIRDGGTAASGNLTSLGVTNNGGPGICVNSAAITGPYNQLCMSVSTTAAATISLQNRNGANPQQLQFNINGAIIPFGTILPLAVGTTVINSGTNNGLLYDSAGVLGNLATGNDGVLITSGTGVPSISSTLPSAVQTNITVLGTITSTILSGDGAGSVRVTGLPTPTVGSDAATKTYVDNFSSLTVGTTPVNSGTNSGLLYDNAGFLGNLATANNGVLITSSGGVPSISSTLPSAVQANITAIGAATATSLTTLLVTGLNTPSGSTDAANKNYVDNLASGLHILAPSRLATAAVLPDTPTYSNGTAGVGATLTRTGNGTLTVDGKTANLNDTILVWKQTSTTGCTVANAGCQNGQYYVSAAGDGSNPWVLTRCSLAACGVEFDTAATMLTGSYTFVTDGDTLVGTAYALQGTVTTVGTTPAVFLLFSSQAVTAAITSIGGQTGPAITCSVLVVCSANNISVTAINSIGGQTGSAGAITCAVLVICSGNSISVTAINSIGGQTGSSGAITCSGIVTCAANNIGVVAQVSSIASQTGAFTCDVSLSCTSGILKVNNSSVNVMSYGASGSASSPTATTSASSTTVTLNTASDFKNGQGILINHAGGVPSGWVTPLFGAPSGLSVAPGGVTGATTYAYRVASIAFNGAVSPATSATTITNGNNTLAGGQLLLDVTNNTGFKLKLASTSGMSNGGSISIAGTNLAALNGVKTIATVDDANHVTLTTAYAAGWSGGGVVGQNYNMLTWTVGASNSYGYAIYRSVSGGAYTLIGFSETNRFKDQGGVVGGVVTGVGTPGLFCDNGSGDVSCQATSPARTEMIVGFNATTRPFWVPATPPDSMLNKWLVGTIVSGGGTITLVLDTAATAAVTEEYSQHDDTAAFASAASAAAGGSLYIPGGHYNVSGTTNITANNSTVFGDSVASTIIEQAAYGYPVFFALPSTGLVNRLSTGTGALTNLAFRDMYFINNQPRLLIFADPITLSPYIYGTAAQELMGSALAVIDSEKVSVTNVRGYNFIQTVSFEGRRRTENSGAATVSASFTSNTSGSSTTVTVSGISGTLLVGDTLTGSGIPTGVTVLSQSTGTTGSNGTYVVSTAVNLTAVSTIAQKTTVTLNASDAALAVACSLSSGGGRLLFVSGAGDGHRLLITGYNSITNVITFSPAVTVASTTPFYTLICPGYDENNTVDGLFAEYGSFDILYTAQNLLWLNSLRGKNGQRADPVNDGTPHVVYGSGDGLILGNNTVSVNNLTAFNYDGHPIKNRGRIFSGNNIFADSVRYGLSIEGGAAWSPSGSCTLNDVTLLNLGGQSYEYLNYGVSNQSPEAYGILLLDQENCLVSNLQTKISFNYGGGTSSGQSFDSASKSVWIDNRSYTGQNFTISNVQHTINTGNYQSYGIAISPPASGTANQVTVNGFNIRNNGGSTTLGAVFESGTGHSLNGLSIYDPFAATGSYSLFVTADVTNLVARLDPLLLPYQTLANTVSDSGVGSKITYNGYYNTGSAWVNGLAVNPSTGNVTVNSCTGC